MCVKRRDGVKLGTFTEKEVVRVRCISAYAEDFYKVVKLSKHLANQKDVMRRECNRRKGR